jgi:hypothetical protein
MFTTEQAEGAWPTGTHVIKIKAEPGDKHPVGATATVLGSIGAPGVGLGYFVEWDALPRHAVFVVAWKLAKAVLWRHEDDYEDD